MLDASINTVSEVACVILEILKLLRDRVLRVPFPDENTLSLIFT